MISTLFEYSLIGLSAGGAYALIALGLVAVFRGTGVVNFAQGAIGTVGTYVFWKTFDDAGLPLPLSILFGIASSTVISVLFYLLVGRRLNKVPVTTRILVTLGLLLALQAAVRLTWGPDTSLVQPFLAQGGFEFLGIRVQYLTLVVLSVTLLLTAGLSLIFERTRFGKVTTALQDSPVGTQSLGYSPVKYGVIVWAIGGTLAAIAGILLSPVTTLSADALNGLLIPALGAAIIAGFRRFWLAAAVALATGVIESVATGFDLGQISRVIPYALAIVAIVVAGRQLPGRGTVEIQRLFRVGSGRIRWTWIAVFGAAIVVAAYALPSRWADTLGITAIFAIIGLSIVVTVGYAGQVSLATMAFTGISALAFGVISSSGTPLLLSILITLVFATVVGIILSLPTVRIRGIGLTVATLAFAGIVENSVFTSDVLYNGTTGWKVVDKTLFGLDLSNLLYPERFAIFAWAVVLVVVVVLANTRRSKAGRALLATRADERAAASVGISVTAAKVYSFTASTVLASLAGIFIALSAGQVARGLDGVSGFSYANSLSELAITVFGGVGFLVGGVLTGVFSSGGLLPQVLSFSPTINEWFALIFGLNLAIGLVWEPDGVVAQNLRLGRWLRRKAGTVASGDPGKKSARVRGAKPLQILEDPLSVLTPVHTAERGETVLTVTDLTLHYGGVAAVDNVSLEVKAGHVVGVLGPNGAGKSSLVDVITGFIPAESGTVSVLGRDITTLPPHKRQRHGLIRTFQDQLLFEDLTVLENVQSGADHATLLDLPLGGLRPRANKVDDEVVAALQLLELEPYARELVENLSLGWHSRVAIARVLAARPSVICLDEPAAALSPESRAKISELIKTIAHRLNIGILLIEHNIDVILDTCDDIIVMDQGALLAQGDPGDVLKRQDVKVAYLGEV